jgi:hypothetical protein
MPEHIYTIEVTAADIAEGVPRSFRWCMASTALGRRIPRARRIDVDLKEVQFSLGDERLVHCFIS